MEIQKIFDDKSNHIAKYEIIRCLNKGVFDDLSKICSVKFNVDLKQYKCDHIYEITITGKKCNEAKAFLV